MCIKRAIGGSLVLVSLAVASCSPAYVANTRNVPLFDKAGETTANISYLSGIDVQLAHSFSDHIAVMANGNVLINNIDFPKQYSPPWPHRQFGEGGIGYFKGGDGLRYEVFGGYGFGQNYGTVPRAFFFKVEDRPVVVLAKYQRIFIQPSVGIDFENSSMIFTTRISAVDFRSYRAYIDSLNYQVPPATAGFNLFFEPAVTWRFHLDRSINAYFQIGINTPLNNVNYRSNVFQLAAGLQLRSRSDKNDD